MSSIPLLLVGKTTLTLKRHTAGSHVNGRWIPSSTTDVIISTNVQPMRFHEKMILDESDRSKKAVKFYTKTEVKGSKEGTSQLDGDTFSWQGDTYRVMKVLNYQMGVLDHYKAIAVREELGAVQSYPFVEGGYGEGYGDFYGGSV